MEEHNKGGSKENMEQGEGTKQKDLNNSSEERKPRYKFFGSGGYK